MPDLRVNANTNTSAPMKGTGRAMERFRAMLSPSGWPRALWSRLFGAGAWGTRNFYEVFGWDITISSQMMWEMYQRGGIAKRIVHAYADTVWGNPPEVSGTQAFTKAWKQLVIDLKIWSVLNRLDKLSQIGEYCVLFVGTTDSNLTTPVKTGANITFLQAYSDRSCRITRWGTDPSDPRFCLPVEYTIYPNIAQTETGGHTSTTVPGIQQASFRVHWSRVLHIAQGQLENELFGVPTLWAIWNYLTDLQKVVGGSSESYWNTANRGMQANIKDDMQMSEEDEANLTAEIEEYFNGQRRFMRTRGVEMKNLGSDVADPKGPFDALLALISGTTGIPQRILIGSESAHQASTQDRANWAERVDFYRVLTAEPYFLMPLIHLFMQIGALPTIKDDKIIREWPPSYIMNPLEKAQQANQKATAMNNLALAARNVTNIASVEELRNAAGINCENGGAIVPGTTPIAPVGTPDQKGASEGNGVVDPGSDGGVPKDGNGSGDKSTQSGTDANGSGDAKTPRK